MKSSNRTTTTALVLLALTASSATLCMQRPLVTALTKNTLTIIRAYQGTKTTDQNSRRFDLPRRIVPSQVQQKLLLEIGKHIATTTINARRLNSATCDHHCESCPKATYLA